MTATHKYPMPTVSFDLTTSAAPVAAHSRAARSRSRLPDEGTGGTPSARFESRPQKGGGAANCRRPGQHRPMPTVLRRRGRRRRSSAVSVLGAPPQQLPDERRAAKCQSQSLRSRAPRDLGLGSRRQPSHQAGDERPFPIRWSEVTPTLRPGARCLPPSPGTPSGTKERVHRRSRRRTRTCLGVGLTSHSPELGYAADAAAQRGTQTGDIHGAPPPAGWDRAGHGSGSRTRPAGLVTPAGPSLRTLV